MLCDAKITHFRFFTGLNRGALGNGASAESTASKGRHVRCHSRNDAWKRLGSAYDIFNALDDSAWRLVSISRHEKSDDQLGVHIQTCSDVLQVQETSYKKRCSNQEDER